MTVTVAPLPLRFHSAADAERAELTAELFRRRDEAATQAEHDEAVDQLVALHLPLARSAANRYQTHRDDHEDVFQVACLGLVKAVLRFDPSVGAPFGAFATPTITGEVRRYFRDHAWDIRPPRWIQEMRPDVQRAVERMTHELGRRPSVPEVAAQLEAGAAQVGETMGAVANCLNVHSLDLPTDGGGTLAVRDSLGSADHDLETAPERMALRPLVAALDDRDRKIIVLRFVRGYTQRRIADEVGLSQTQVCRLLDRILADLRSQLEEQPAPTLV
jgi:RNA polymerase sigma-B factor